MLVKTAYEYTGYLTSRLAAVGEAVDALNLFERVTYWTSSGPCDPIIPSGTTARYTVSETDVPDWLLEGIERGQQDGRWEGHEALWWAVKYARGGHEGDWTRALGQLCRTPDRWGRWGDTLRDFFRTRGYLTEKQAATLNRTYRRRH